MAAGTNRLVITSKAILRTLYQQKIGANELFKQTSSKDRSYFFGSLSKLKKENLIISTEAGKGKGKRGFKTILSLSELGKQIEYLYECIDNFRRCHDAFRQTRLLKIGKEIETIKRTDESGKIIPIEKRMIIDQKNRPIQGSLGIEELSFDYFNKLVFYRCGQILSNTKKNSKIVQALIDNIVSIMVSYYSEQVKQMMDVDDPGAIKGLNTQEDFIKELSYISAEHLLLKDSRIGSQTIDLLDSLFSMIKNPIGWS